MIQRTDLRSDMEVSESQQDRVQLLSEKRKWQTEIENKKRQLEDDKRTLQHLKSKALRERWLLDGAPSAGPEQDAVRRQLEQDETRTRSLEDNIHRLEEELLSLETGSMCQIITHTAVCSGSGEAVGIKGQPERAAAVAQIAPEVRVPKSPRVNAASEDSEEMKRAMYSVEIKVERDRLTGETRVLSTNTTLPVDFSHRGVKVYEDEKKVVHEMNGEDSVQLLSVSEVEDLIHKADEASVMSQTVTTVTSLPTAEVAAAAEASPEASPPAEIRGLRAEPGGNPGLADASAAAPLTMVFMGYQSVEDEDETKKVFGLVGTVTAERVLIPASEETSPSAAQEAPPPHFTDKPTETAAAPVGNGEPMAEEVREGKVGKEAKEGNEAKEGKEGKVVKEGKEGNEGKEGREVVEEMKKEKQPCKCCSIM